MSSFDGKYVVFGKVVEGLQYLKKVSEKQDPHSLNPSSKQVIQEISIIERKPTEEFIRRQEEDSSRRPHLDKFISFKDHENIMKYIDEFQKEMAVKKFVKGPEIIEIRNLKSSDDFYKLSQLPLCNVHTAIFKDCDFNLNSTNKLLKQGGFFKSVFNWEFFGCDLSKPILKEFFINKHTQPARSLVIEPKERQSDLFKILINWKKLGKVSRFAFIGSMIGPQDLSEFITKPIFSQLSYLDLSHTKFYDEGIAEFIEKFNNQNIRGIYLGSTGITSKSAVALLKNKSFSKLEILDLSNNFDMDQAVIHISSSKSLNFLKELYFRNTHLTIHSLYELVNSFNFSTVRKLDISYNFSLKDDFAVALREKTFIRQLEYLNMENCNISNETIKDFSENRHLKSLKELDISNNPSIRISSLIEELENLKFLQLLDNLHVANLGISEPMLKEIRDELRVNLETYPMVSRDRSDYLEHINVPLLDGKMPPSPEKPS